MTENVNSILGLSPENSAGSGQAGTAIHLPQPAETSVWSFKGRIGRGSFWARFFLLQGLSLLVGFIIRAISEAGESALIPVIVIYLGYLIFAVWFSLAFQVKRWHDLNVSGWMVLVNFTIIALPIVLIIQGCVRGTKGPNKYGSDPLPEGTVLNMRKQEGLGKQTIETGETQEAQ